MDAKTGAEADPQSLDAEFAKPMYGSLAKAVIGAILVTGEVVYVIARQPESNGLQPGLAPISMFSCKTVGYPRPLNGSKTSISRRGLQNVIFLRARHDQKHWYALRQFPPQFGIKRRPTDFPTANTQTRFIWLPKVLAKPCSSIKHRRLCNAGFAFLRRSKRAHSDEMPEKLTGCRNGRKPPGVFTWFRRCDGRILEEGAKAAQF